MNTNESAVARVSVVGLGKLGLPMLAYFASKGCVVVGVDTNAKICQTVNAGSAPWYEAGLQEILTNFRGRYHATTDTSSAIAETDITFVVVPTPSDNSGYFSNIFVLGAAKEIGFALAQKKGNHLVVLTSTVMPGTTKDMFIGQLRECSGKTCNSDFGVCYNPEFIALGSVINDLENPDLLLIGQSNDKYGQMLQDFYRAIGCKAPCMRMNTVNAEIAKISINSFMTLKISFANSLAVVCEKFADASVVEVTKALGADSRIGRKYLKAGLGYGGPCFPRDNVALAELAFRVGVPQLNFADAIDSFNKDYLDHVVERICRYAPSVHTVGILGLAYKSGTPVLTESHGLEIARRVVGHFKNVVVYDEFALNNAKSYLGNGVVYANSIDDFTIQADLLVIALPIGNPQAFISRVHARHIIFDCWPGTIDPMTLPNEACYVSIGEQDK